MAPRGFEGSPRMKMAASKLIKNPGLNSSEALLLVGYRAKDTKSVRKRNLLAVTKWRMIKLAERTAKSERASKKAKQMKERRTAAKKKGQGRNTWDKENVAPAATGTKLAPTSLSKVTTSNVVRRSSQKTPLKGSKPLASKSRRTPCQMNAFNSEKKATTKNRKLAHESALQQLYRQCNKEFLGEKKSYAQIARDVTAEFGIDVKSDTLRKLHVKGATTISKPGPNGDFPIETYNNICVAVITYIALSQINGDPEKKANAMIGLLQNTLGKVKNSCSSRNLWRKVQKDYSDVFEISKEQAIELRRQLWTTFDNLNDWFDAWEKHCVQLGFASEKHPYDDEFEGGVYFPEEQKKRIINMDETSLSLDGSDGLRGGRPAYSITVRGQSRPGTPTNKSSVSSTLMCGSNAAGEPLPLNICFSSDAQEEENYQVKASWIQGLPQVSVRFGHVYPITCSATVTVNTKGGTDSRVLKQLLIQYIEKLFPDASDTFGNRVLIKIDGGPGRLDLSSLAEQRSRGVYLFPGVQNTTHITQETDQNYG
ncbi:MAG: hypothetical protein ACREOZ_02970, partial [Gloeomargaritales cyanobacterium]